MDRPAAPLIDWTEGGVPVSRRFEDPYFSLRNGVAETAHVFLAGNGLPDRFRPGFHVAELGFGTGLSMTMAWQAWRQAAPPGPLLFTSFEAFPLSSDDILRALGPWPDLAVLATEFLAAFDGQHARLQDLEFQLISGDARQTLPRWQGKADAWVLDGFAPARNPELWDPALMQAVARHTKPQGTFATYTAAGHVRRALDAAGFEVTRSPGYAHKRHMSHGRLR